MIRRVVRTYDKLFRERPAFQEVERMSGGVLPESFPHAMVIASALGGELNPERFDEIVEITELLEFHGGRGSISYSIDMSEFDWEALDDEL